MIPLGTRNLRVGLGTNESVSHVYVRFLDRCMEHVARRSLEVGICSF
jgi:hypothetical protein